MPPLPKASKKIVQKMATHAETVQKHRIFRDGLYSTFLIVAILLCVLVLVVLAIKVRPKDFVVPVQYSSLQGFDRLASWYQVYIYGLFSVGVTVGNIILAAKAYNKSRLASFFLLFATTLVNLLTVVIVFILSSHVEL